MFAGGVARELEADEVIVFYFDDAEDSYCVVRFADLLHFDTTIEPYLSFTAIPTFKSDPRIKLCHRYFTTGQITSRWPAFYDSVDLPKEMLIKACEGCELSGELCGGERPECRECAWKGRMCSFRLESESYESRRDRRGKDIGMIVHAEISKPVVEVKAKKMTREILGFLEADLSTVDAYIDSSRVTGLSTTLSLPEESVRTCLQIVDDIASIAFTRITKHDVLQSKTERRLKEKEMRRESVREKETEAGTGDWYDADCDPGLVGIEGCVHLIKHRPAVLDDSPSKNASTAEHFTYSKQLSLTKNNWYKYIPDFSSSSYFCGLFAIEDVRVARRMLGDFWPAFKDVNFVRAHRRKLEALKGTAAKDTFEEDKKARKSDTRSRHSLPAVKTKPASRPASLWTTKPPKRASTARFPRAKVQAMDEDATDDDTRFSHLPSTPKQKKAAAPAPKRKASLGFESTSLVVVMTTIDTAGKVLHGDRRGSGRLSQLRRDKEEDVSSARRNSGAKKQEMDDEMEYGASDEYAPVKKRAAKAKAVPVVEMEDAIMDCATDIDDDFVQHTRKPKRKPDQKRKLTTPKRQKTQIELVEEQMTHFRTPSPVNDHKEVATFIRDVVCELIDGAVTMTAAETDLSRKVCIQISDENTPPVCVRLNLFFLIKGRGGGGGGEEEHEGTTCTGSGHHECGDGMPSLLGLTC